MFGHYVKATGVDRGEFLADYARLGAQRNAKIVGIFVRLWKRDGKPRYLDMIPRVCMTLMLTIGIDLHRISLGALIAEHHAEVGRGHAEQLVPMIAQLPDGG